MSAAGLPIGMDRRVHLSWLDAAATCMMQGASPTLVRERLNQLLDGVVAGNGSHSAKGKTITVLMHIWVSVPRELQALRDQGLALLQTARPCEHIWLHYGMALATYPFFRDVAMTAGRLINLQGSFTLAQLTRRMTERWGERTTLQRAVQRVARSLVDWGALQGSQDRGMYQAAPPQAMPNLEIGAWMLEALLRGGGLRMAPFGQLVQSPALFHFSIPLRPVDLRDHPRFEVLRQGLDEDTLLLRFCSQSEPARGAPLID